MSAEFIHMEQHRDRPGAPAPNGRVVLSDLRRGDTPIVSCATSIKFVLEGEERYEMDDSAIVLRSGQFAVVRPFVSMRCTLPRPSLGLCIYFPTAEPVASIEGEDFLGPAQVFSAAGTRLGSLLEAVGRRLYHQPHSGAGEAGTIVGGAQVELDRLALDASARAERLSVSKTSTRRELFRRADFARAYLHQNRDRAVTLQELGEAAGISPFHLARAFQALYGAPPMTYHTRLRLEAGAALLADGLTAGEAAVRLGYSEPSAFSRAFKRLFGEAPGAYAANSARSVKGAV